MKNGKLPNITAHYFFSSLPPLTYFLLAHMLPGWQNFLEGKHLIVHSLLFVRYSRTIVDKF